MEIFPGEIKTSFMFLVLFSVVPVAESQRWQQDEGTIPEAEFHMGRLIYSTRGYGRMWRPWWAIDYPEAEYHITQGLKRLTLLDVSDDSRHLEITDDRIFDHPWLLAQQVGHWHLSDLETLRLREYLLRGGFLVADDFHGTYEYAVFMDVIGRVFPDRPVIDIPESDALLHVLYDLNQRTQIPGRRHLWQGTAHMEGPPRWQGVYDDEGRLLVAINFNMDMGDAWEHADDPSYPEPMTALAYRFGINYIIYAMTH